MILFIYLCRSIGEDRHGEMGRDLPLNAGGPEFELRSHNKDFIFECCSPGAEFRILDCIWGYPVLMGTCNGEISWLEQSAGHSVDSLVSHTVVKEIPLPECKLLNHSQPTKGLLEGMLWPPLILMAKLTNFMEE